MARERRPDREKRLARFADPGKNLRAAHYFHGLLRQEQEKVFGGNLDHIGFCLSACINAANAVIEALSVKVGREDVSLEPEWRRGQDPDELALLDRFRDLRIEDFHYGILETPVSKKWVNAATIPGVTVSAPPGVFLERTNPDGEVVRGAALTNVRTLNIEHAGAQIDASEACRRVMGLVENLVRYEQETKAP